MATVLFLSGVSLERRELLDHAAATSSVCPLLSHTLHVCLSHCLPVFYYPIITSHFVHLICVSVYMQVRACVYVFVFV